MATTRPSRWWILRPARTLGSAIVLILAAASGLTAQDRPAPPIDLSATRPPAPKNRHPRLDSELNRVIADAERRGERAAAQSTLMSADASVAVTLHVAHAASDTAAFLTSRGAVVANVATDVIEAYVPVRELAALERLPGLLKARAIVPPQPLATSQGRIVHNAGAWNTNGSGVRVGIIDTGFLGYSALMGTELPPPAAVRCYTAIGVFSSRLADCQTGSSHGTAVAEAVNDMVPAASLYLSQPMSASDLLSTAQWMIAEGVTVINHSVGWSWAGPGDGTSIYSNSPLAAVNAAVAGGAVWVNAAGNSGRSRWTGPYQDQDNDQWLEFVTGAEPNPVFLPAGVAVVVQARWQDTWGAATRDFDVYLLNSALQIVASSTDDQAGRAGSVPFEVFSYTPALAGTYYVAVHRYSASSLPGWIQVETFTGQPLGYYSPAFSIANPAESANPGALAVGAAAWYSTTIIEPFSSQGPTRDGRVKPDLIGADRGDSVTYGVNAFAGTSQAAPHVAGLAALVRQRHGSLTPAGVADYLKTNAQPRGFPVPNTVWGWGLAFLPAPACSYQLSATTHSLGPGGGTGSVGVTTECAWTAASNASWITVTSGSSGTGNGVVTFSVDSNVLHNTATATRTGTITIAGNTFTVVQAGCSFGVSPASATFGPGGGSGTLSITTGNACTWSATRVGSWITITGGGSGSGNGVVNYSVAPNRITNTPTPERAGTITVAGSSAAVTQTGCSFSVTPDATTFDAAGGSGVVEVTTGSACTWTATGTPAWSSSASPSNGSGSGLWRYNVSPNATGSSRSAVVSVAGQAFALTQLAVAVRPIVAGRRIATSLPGSPSQQWASLEAVTGRSYCVAVSPAPSETSRATPQLAAFRADAFTPLSTGGGGAAAQCFIAPATETTLFRTTQSEPGPRKYLLSAVETTIWANWFFVGGTYSSYSMLRNTTGSPVTALITWRDTAGGVVARETVTVPARGLIYRDARGIVPARTVAGAVEVAHDGPPSALVGSQTTLSPTTGLSFDTLLRTRRHW